MENNEIEFAPELPDKIVDKSKNGFSKLHNQIIDSHILCMLAPSSVLLYLLLMRLAYNNKGYVYTNQIKEFTNIPKAHIARYFNQLVLFRLITITGQSKRHGYKQYSLTAQQDLQDPNSK